MGNKKSVNKWTYKRRPELNEQGLIRVPTENNKYEFVKDKPKVEPGQALPIAETIKRALHGNIADRLTVGQFYGSDHDSEDMEKFGKLDIIEQREVVRKLRTKLYEKVAEQKDMKLKAQMLKDESKKLLEQEKLEKQFEESKEPPPKK